MKWSRGPSGAKRALNECVNGVIVDVPVTDTGMEAAEVRTVPLWSCIEDEVETGAGAEVEPSISELRPGVEESGRESYVDGDKDENGEEVLASPTALSGRVPSEGKDTDLADLVGNVGPVSVGQETAEFREAVKRDPSLKEWRELGDRRERGFLWKQDVLVRSMYVAWDEFMDVLVVPKEFRERIMVLGHEKSGHSGQEKVSKLIGKRFVWPFMSKDIMHHCKKCVVCQKMSKYRPKKVPAVERPVLTEPFEDVAMDIVGPLEKGKG